MFYYFLVTIVKMVLWKHRKETGKLYRGLRDNFLWKMTLEPSFKGKEKLAS